MVWLACFTAYYCLFLELGYFMKIFLLIVTLCFNAFALPGPIVVENARAVVMKGPNRGAAYATFTNTSDQTIFLVGFESENVSKPELHTHIEKDGRMSMVAVPRMEIKPGKTLELKEGGLHLMFDASPKLNAETDIQITLHFENEKGETFTKMHAFPQKQAQTNSCCGQCGSK
jgi:copper(I)-binding protein